MAERQYNGQMRMRVVDVIEHFIAGDDQVTFQGYENNRIVLLTGYGEWVVGMEADVYWELKPRGFRRT